MIIRAHNTQGLCTQKKKEPLVQYTTTVQHQTSSSNIKKLHHKKAAIFTILIISFNSHMTIIATTKVDTMSTLPQVIHLVLLEMPLHHV